jgi:Fibronectin type III domain
MKRIVFTILFVTIFALCFVHSASAQVGNLKAEYDSDTSVMVTWTYSGPTLNKDGRPISLEIAKSTSATGPFTWIGVSGTRSPGGFKDTNVNKLIKPYYRVSSGQEPTPPIVQAKVPYALDPTAVTGNLGTNFTAIAQDPSKAPTSFLATAGDGQVALTWGAKMSGTTYNVKSSLSNAGPFNVIKSLLTTPNFTVTGLPNGTTQYFVVSAVYNGTESPNSLVVSAIPTAPPVKLTAPTGLTGRGTSGDMVSLYWNALAGATSYSIKMAKTSGGPYTTLKSDLTTTRFEATGLTRSTTYYFVVSATNSLGQSPNSPQIQVATPNYIR